MESKRDMFESSVVQASITAVKRKKEALGARLAQGSLQTAGRYRWAKRAAAVAKEKKHLRKLWRRTFSSP